MNKEDKIKSWEDKIIDNFIGPNGWNGERVLTLDKTEKEILSEIV